MSEPDKIAPNPGPQTEFLQCNADVAIYGGAAGGGKSFALLLDVARGAHKPGFNAVIFRRQSTELDDLWKEAKGLYERAFPDAEFINSHPYRVKFPSGAELKLTHLNQEKDKKRHKGAEYDLIAFDELTGFTETQFTYLLTRSRTTNSGVDPWVRATTNPDKTSWVRQWVDPYIGPDGLPVDATCGEVKYFTIDEGTVQWVGEGWTGPDADIVPTSFTFIAATLEDNPALLEKSPKYKSQLYNKDRVVRERLLRGNWDAAEIKGPLRRHAIQMVDATPDDAGRAVRYWDLADTDASDNPDASHTACVKTRALQREWTICMGETDEGEGCTWWTEGVPESGECPKCGAGADKLHTKPRTVVVVTHAEWFQLEGDRKETMIEHIASSHDDYDTIQGIEQEPGATGKDVARKYKRRILDDWVVNADNPTGDKLTRMDLWVPMAKTGRLWVLNEPWAADFIHAVEALEPMDVADATSGSVKISTNYAGSSYIGSF